MRTTRRVSRLGRRLARPSPRHRVELELAAQAAEDRRQRCPVAAFLQERVWDALDSELDTARRAQLEAVLLRLADRISVGQDVSEDEAARAVVALLRSGN